MSTVFRESETIPAPKDSRDNKGHSDPEQQRTDPHHLVVREIESGVPDDPRPRRQPRVSRQSPLPLRSDSPAATGETVSPQTQTLTQQLSGRLLPLPDDDAPLHVLRTYVDDLWGLDCQTKQLRKMIRYNIGKALSARIQRDQIAGNVESWIESEFQIPYRDARYYIRFSEEVSQNELDGPKSYSKICREKGIFGNARQVAEKWRELRYLEEVVSAGQREGADDQDSCPESRQASDMSSACDAAEQSEEMTGEQDRQQGEETSTRPFTPQEFESRLRELFQRGIAFPEWTEWKEDDSRLLECESLIQGLKGKLDDLLEGKVKPAIRDLRRSAAEEVAA